MLRWIIFSTLAAGLFYGLYCLTFKRDRWLQLSRAYLILTLAFSLAFPLVQLPASFSAPFVSDLSSGTGMLNADLPEIVISSGNTSATHPPLLTLAYQIGLAVTVAFLLTQLMLQFLSILRLRRKHSAFGARDGFSIPQHAYLIMPPDDTAPYSFFNHIVVGTRDLSNEELRCILAHESLHVRQSHSLDLTLMRLLCCLAWFNPFAWLMLRELRAVHEFQADGAALDACGRQDYLHLLYRQVTSIGYGHITNNFQSINLKKRIAMMNKTKTRLGAWKLLAALPLAALLMMFGCKNNASPEPDNSTAAVNDTVYDALENPAEVQPAFPGGEEAMYQYLAENINYPEQAKKDHIQGRVIVSFVVDAEGNLVETAVAKGIGGGCDEEALRVVNAMPKWVPGQVRGENVRVKYNLVIVFKLQ